MINSYGFSVVGKSHIERNVCCQDSHCIQKLGNGWYVAAIADGVGSAANAEIGSNIAAKAAVNFCCNNMPFDYNVEGIKATIRTAFSYAYNCICEEARKSDNPIENYDTTLSLAIYDGYHVIYGHSGDGAIIGLSKFCGFIEITRPQKGDDAVSVIPLRAGNDVWEISDYNGELSSVLLVTDGMRDTVCPSLLRLDQKLQKVYTPLGLFFSISCGNDWEKEKEKIKTFLESENSYDLEQFYERLTEIYNKFIPDEAERIVCQIKQYDFPVALMYHEQDDKTVVALINLENEPFFEKRDFFEEPDWERLKQIRWCKLYPHLCVTEEKDLKLEPCETEEHSTVEQNEAYIHSTMKESNPKKDLELESDKTEGYLESKPNDIDLSLFFDATDEQEIFVPQNNENNKGFWDRLVRKYRRNRK